MSETKLMCCICQGYWPFCILFLIKISNNRPLKKKKNMFLWWWGLRLVALENYWNAYKGKTVNLLFAPGVQCSYNHGVTFLLSTRHLLKAFCSSGTMLGPGNLKWGIGFSVLNLEQGEMGCPRKRPKGIQPMAGDRGASEEGVTEREV